MSGAHDQPGDAVKTLSGLELDRVFAADPARDYAREIGDPGEFPYTRGIHPGMHRDQLWTMRQYAGFGTAAETNRRFRYLLASGQTGLSVAFDLPTQTGLDSDHPLAEGEVGRVGVAIDTLDDMATLFDGIPLDAVSTSMTINATAPILLALYLTVASRQGAAWSGLRGTVQNDILKEYIARGTQIYPPRGSLRLVTDVIEFCEREVPRWNPISVSGYHVREAGATAVQEVAFTLANAMAYVESALDRGLDPDRVLPRISFFFGVHNDFLEEIAKFRAARRIWARLARDRFGARDPRSLKLRFHAQTAGSTLTAQFPDANVARVAWQALAAVLGGAQSLHTNAKDEALALPSEEAARLALRTQQIVAFESGVANTADPVGGAYAIEALTDRLEAAVLGELARIEALGGAGAAIESGWVQREIHESAYRDQRAVESGARVVVGVNRYRPEDDRPGAHIPLHRTDPESERGQIQSLARVRRRRDGPRVEAALARLRAAAAGAANLMPLILEAVAAEASVGEISDVLRSVFGEYREAHT